MHVSVSEAGAWVADLRRTIRDFGDKPFVRITLKDGEQFFLKGLSAGPGDAFVTLHAYRAQESTAPVLAVRLDTISKVELLRESPGRREAGYTFNS